MAGPSSFKSLRTQQNFVQLPGGVITGAGDFSAEGWFNFHALLASGERGVWWMETGQFSDYLILSFHEDPTNGLRLVAYLQSVDSATPTAAQVVEVEWDFNSLGVAIGVDEWHWFGVACDVSNAPATTFEAFYAPDGSTPSSLGNGTVLQGTTALAAKPNPGPGYAGLFDKGLAGGECLPVRAFLWRMWSDIRTLAEFQTWHNAVHADPTADGSLDGNFFIGPEDFATTHAINSGQSSGEAAWFSWPLPYLVPTWESTIPTAVNMEAVGGIGPALALNGIEGPSFGIANGGYRAAPDNGAPIMEPVDGGVYGGLVIHISDGGYRAAPNNAVDVNVQGIGGTGVTLDTTKPFVTNITPPPGPLAATAAQARVTPVQFDVLDLDPGIATVVIWCKFAARQDRVLVYDGESFVWPFDHPSSIAYAITDGLHFTVLHRSPGWPDTIEQLFIKAIDHHGNIE